MLEKIKEILVICLNFIKGVYNNLKDAFAQVELFNKIYAYLDGIWPLHGKFRLDFAITIAIALLAILILALIFGGISRAKKRKVRFYVDGKLYAVTKTKLKRPIVYPDVPTKEGFEFAGWYIGKKLKKQPKKKLKKKRLKLYAKFVEAANVVSAEEPAVQPIEVKPQVEEPVKEVEVQPVVVPEVAAPVVEENTVAIQPKVDEVEQSGVVEEVIEIPNTVTLGDLYDDIRFEMLGYERASSFKKMGVVRKHVIAEMFEKDEQIYLYLAANPSLMKQKGFNVEAFTQQEFAIVPCKKVIKTVEDAEEAKALIKEVMTLNHLVKSEIVCAKKVVSDEQTRKNGFAFYVKNEVVVTSSADYYKILRAIVLSYSASKLRKIPANVENKMILKIFKKEEKVYLYLALDADKEGLEFVGYDKNFIDTPAMFEIKTAEDCFKANELIDKLMYVYGMDKNPEQAEISLEDTVEASCGFGYRIRR
ncbi:MAG: InlB B-repeat-containing protein [Clostridia bacterium]|nr:InlB B-repeat-containing protein [Clostridia bacterium]